MNTKSFFGRMPEKKIDVIEQGQHPGKDYIPLELERDIRFSTTSLRTYSFARWEPVLYDAMVVAAAIEFGDRTVMRPTQEWARRISLKIPVNDPARWNAPDTSAALHDAVGFLTGDHWSIDFIRRSSEAPSPPQDYLNLKVPTEAVIAYSDGMDSLAVAGILGEMLGEKLVRVRVGAKSSNKPSHHNGFQPFTNVPYKVSSHIPKKESSFRSRGFKFTLISAIAAYITDAEKIIVPESGQGVFGPVLVDSGHTYKDYRNHPLFTMRMQRFIEALLGKQVRYIFPRIWNTKGETLKKFISLSSKDDWQFTRSCWRSNQWNSVNRKWRHCGVCAACMLRRVAVHAAGLGERPDTYISTNMSAATLDDAVDPDFTKLNSAYLEYAIAGVLHMERLATMAKEDMRPLVERHAMLLEPALNHTREEIFKCLRTLLLKHAEEWQDYLDSLGPNSFVKQWARG